VKLTFRDIEEAGMNEHLKKVVAHHDWWSKTYDSDYFEHFALYHKITLDNIRRFLPKEKGNVMLDAGGGTGIWSIELATMGYHVVLTDISRGMLEKAKEKVSELKLDNQVEIRISNICNMPEFEDNQFAMVICEGDSLSYCGDHHAAIKELVRVVQPGGIVIASVDNRMSTLNLLREKKGRRVVQRLLETGEVVMPQAQEEFRYLIHAFTPKELRELFESNGLLVERIIGKPVIAHRLACSKSEDPVVQEWLYALELKYNDNPAFYPWGEHLEIVGRKR
jgi:ubiquinone/menaquinone biosynthesis C-methylase UbiE